MLSNQTRRCVGLRSQWESRLVFFFQPMSVTFTFLLLTNERRFPVSPRSFSPFRCFSSSAFARRRFFPFDPRSARLPRFLPHVFRALFRIYSGLFRAVFLVSSVIHFVLLLFVFFPRPMSAFFPIIGHFFRLLLHKLFFLLFCLFLCLLFSASFRASAL